MISFIILIDVVHEPAEKAPPVTDLGSGTTPRVDEPVLHAYGLCALLKDDSERIASMWTVGAQGIKKRRHVRTKQMHSLRINIQILTFSIRAIEANVQHWD